MNHPKKRLMVALIFAILLAVSVFLIFYNSPKKYSGNRINIISATYGSICRVPFNNVKDETMKKCNDLSICKYTIDYQDPMPLCGKDYKVEWSCTRSKFFDSVYNIKLNPEAFGTKLELNCPFQRH